MPELAHWLFGALPAHALILNGIVARTMSNRALLLLYLVSGYSLSIPVAACRHYHGSA